MDSKNIFSSREFFHSYALIDRISIIFGSDRILNDKIINCGFTFNFDNQQFESLYIFDKDITLELYITKTYKDNSTYELKIVHIDTDYTYNFVNVDLAKLLFDFHLNFKKICNIPLLMKINDNYVKLLENKSSQGNLKSLKDMTIMNGYGNLEYMTKTHIIYKNTITSHEYFKLLENKRHIYYTSSNEFKYNDYKMLDSDKYLAQKSFKISTLTNFQLENLINIQNYTLEVMIDRKTFKTFVEEDKTLHTITSEKTENLISLDGVLKENKEELILKQHYLYE